MCLPFKCVEAEEALPTRGSLPPALRPITPTRYQESTSEEDANAADEYLDASPEVLEPESPPEILYHPALDGCRNVDEFEYLNRIEEGTYGVVYRGKEKRSGVCCCSGISRWLSVFHDLMPLFSFVPRCRGAPWNDVSYGQCVFVLIVTTIFSDGQCVSVPVHITVVSYRKSP